MKSIRLFVLLAACALTWPLAAGAQAAAAPPADDPDLDINFSQPDFTVVTLPTTLRLPRFKSSFRVTHRFTRSLGQGDFGSLAEDFFSLDSGSVIGLEYRFGIARGLQAGVHRTSDRTIAFFGQYNVLQQKDAHPVGLDVVAQIDGTNNFRDSYSPSLGVAISRSLGSHGALYFDPMWVNNSNPLPKELTGDNNTFLFGLGARIRVRPTVYLVGELVPRTGFTPGVNHATFGIEKRAGGHVFQLNFSNGFGTMMSQVARGGIANDDWYMGFNLSRKFF
jgi:hypothetical protein